MNGVKIAGRFRNISQSSGMVTGLHERQTTSVNVQGDQAWTENHIYREFYIRNGDQETGPFWFWDNAISLRNGHHVTWLNALKPNGENYALAIENHSNN
ncbi:hypothetical protein AB1L42_07965 [Thalassoglobus sp. JC818]|uniref:hypothetical protein n=1 Tax=Thalassoglobus sp. JC818 TaxID=3232136 RepID=UPI003459C15D